MSTLTHSYLECIHGLTHMEIDQSKSNIKDIIALN